MVPVVVLPEEARSHRWDLRVHKQEDKGMGKEEGTVAVRDSRAAEMVEMGVCTLGERLDLHHHHHAVASGEILDHHRHHRHHATDVVVALIVINKHTWSLFFSFVRWTRPTRVLIVCEYLFLASTTRR